MDRIEQTYSVLTVSAADKFSASLHTLLPEGQYDPVRAVRDGRPPGGCCWSRASTSSSSTRRCPTSLGRSWRWS